MAWFRPHFLGRDRPPEYRAGGLVRKLKAKGDTSMSEANEATSPGTSGLFQFPGAFAQNFLDFIGKQAATVQQTTGVPVPGLPMPEAEAMVKLQREYAERYSALWTSLVNRKSGETRDRKSTRLNSSHHSISYAV